MKDNIKNELSAFQAFKKQFVFTQHPLVKTDQDISCEGELLQTPTDRFGETEHFINVGYNIRGSSFCQLLSNLFPYEFEFRGFKLASMESFFQGLKFPDEEVQRMVFNYSGTNAVHLAKASLYDWKKTKTLYWQGEAIDRMSEAYDALVDEAYVCLLQNPLYRQSLLNCPKEIIHMLGNEHKEETVFTRYEFEKELNCLRAFVKQSEVGRE